MALFDRKQRGRVSSPLRLGHGRIESKALTAASMSASQDSAAGLQRLHQGWQSQAFGYYNKIGECWNPAQFYSRAMSKMRIFVGIRDENGEIEEVDDPATQAFIDTIQDPAGGQSGVLAAYGRLIFLVGEGRLTQSRIPESLDPESGTKPPVWEFLSPTEIALRNEGRTIVRTMPGEDIEYDNISELAGDEPAPGQMRMWRLWRRHPENSAYADSPVRAVLDLYEQLWWVTMGERSDIQSRIAAAGLLLIPEEIDFQGPEAETEATGEDPEVDPFTRMIGEAMMEAIGEPGSASAAVPLVIRAPADQLHPDRFRHIRMYDATSSMFASQREEQLIRRISIGLDLPVEEVMGLSQANHWTAWKIEDEKWQHVQPVIQMFCDDLGAAYLRPMARAAGLANAEELVVGYDNTALVTDPDKGKTAIQLHKDGVLAAAATLDANGFGTEDMMEGDERLEWLAIALRDATLIGGEATGAPEEEADEAPEEEEEAPSESEAPGRDDQAAALTERIREYADHRARELAGARVRGMRQRCPECFDGAEDVPNARLIAHLGPEVMQRLRLGRSRMAEQMAGVYVEVCEGLGVEPPDTVDLVSHFGDTLYR